MDHLQHRPCADLRPVDRRHDRADAGAQRPISSRALVLCDTAHKVGTADFLERPHRAVEDRAACRSHADAVMRALVRAGLSRQTRRMRRLSQHAGATVGRRLCRELRGPSATPISPPSRQRIDVPAIVVVGEHDGSTPPSSRARWRDLIPGSRYEVIRKRRHIPCVEQPEA
jgi:3-oxoadipate enol-lactonase